MTVDAWQGDAWIGLVAFHMSGVRPRWSPAIPYLSRFPETNVRTYVRYGDNEPGVWFFSLEAARLPAVLIARWGWQLNYRWSRMRVDGTPIMPDTRLAAGSTATPAPKSRRNRRAEDAVSRASDRKVEIGFAATLDEFLVERYVFYNVGRRGRIPPGRVRHRPYPLSALG